MKSASAPSSLPSSDIQGSFTDCFGGRYYRITHVDQLPTFFMNVVSSSDLWLFAASNGGLTAGRVNSERALFPYGTVDRVYDSAGTVGPFTALWCQTAQGPALWEPFAAHTPQFHGVTRNLYKSLEGDRVWFEEENHALGLVFRYGWSTAEDYGFVRQVELENRGVAAISVRLLDGLRNLLVPGVTQKLQNEYSCLTDAYKFSEVVPGTTLGLYALAAGIVDQAIPMESLRSSVVWSEGLPGAAVLVSDSQISTFLKGGVIAAEPSRRGIRASYFLSSELTLTPKQTISWMMVADVGLTQADAAAVLLKLKAGGFGAKVLAAANESTHRLRVLVGLADGLQTGADEPATAHHFANVLFNVLRGGVFVSNHDIPTADFTDFVRTRNKGAYERHSVFLSSLPKTLTRAELAAKVAQQGDPDLERLGFEYLPITFSRRHGDPSRPWNRFNIRIRDEVGNRVLNHEGNWRDIFQNWEALCVSYPDFLENIVAKFVNASTADGYNPYRITRAGIEWEAPEPDDPWASIGYWGDHQVIYLLKLMEWSHRFHPGRLEGWLRRALFSYANVPYIIADYEAIRRNPRSTITFDAKRHQAIYAHVKEFGTDAKLIADAHGKVLHVNLAEKLLILIATRLTNFIPGGGIWMNTQRPEWNDANNALVGNGVSMVTLYYLRRFLNFWRDQIQPALGSEPVVVSGAIATLLQDLTAALKSHEGLLKLETIGSGPRRALVDQLETAGSNYRSHLYKDGLGARTPLAPADIAHLIDTALAFVDHTIRANRRPDGLYNAYNLLHFTENPPGLEVHHLSPMLEGQVAVLSAGLLKPEEVLDLLAALRMSPLYRADQHSYLLYPDKPLPGFLARNVIPAELVAVNPLLAELVEAGDTRLILKDPAGDCRFHPDLVNSTPLEERIAALGLDPRWADLSKAHAQGIREIYENVFHHRAFTGRSGSMFGYEGLGCIYWHMISKLLLAVQENLNAAKAAQDPAADRLVAAYYDIRSGLSFNKTPLVYGAFPTDPYSHTPGHSGAQQPGMTGQVKEEILTRFGELGVEITGGSIKFAPQYLRPTEFSTEAATFRSIDPAGQEASLSLPADSLAFTFCGVPVIYRHAATKQIAVTFKNGAVETIAGTELDPLISAELCNRTGKVTKVEVTC